MDQGHPAEMRRLQRKLFNGLLNDHKVSGHLNLIDHTTSMAIQPPHSGHRELDMPRKEYPQDLHSGPSLHCSLRLVTITNKRIDITLTTIGRMGIVKR
jgi:hypothetical protein